MKDTVNKEEIKNVIGGAAEAVRDITDENALNTALKDLEISMNDTDLAKDFIKQDAIKNAGKCPTCKSRHRDITVLF